MIIVRVHGRDFKYGGNILLTHDEDFLCVTARFVAKLEDESLFMWDGIVYDKFFLEDVESIRGEP